MPRQRGAGEYDKRSDRRGSCAAPLSPAEQLHEVRASLAGVASAIRILLQHDPDLPPSRQHRLEALLESEVDRLERLVFDEAPRSPAVWPLADVVEPVIEARRLTGQVIHCQPSNDAVVVVADFLAEAVNVLLVNAEQHAGGSPVRIDVAREGGDLVIRVSDGGPGVPPYLAEHVFESGVRGPCSSGAGLGLSLARRLARAQGGDLRLADASPRGATFELVVPTPGTA